MISRHHRLKLIKIIFFLIDNKVCVCVCVLLLLLNDPFMSLALLGLYHHRDGMGVKGLCYIVLSMHCLCKVNNYHKT